MTRIIATPAALMSGRLRNPRLRMSCSPRASSAMANITIETAIAINFQGSAHRNQTTKMTAPRMARATFRNGSVDMVNPGSWFYNARFLCNLRQFTPIICTLSTILISTIITL